MRRAFATIAVAAILALGGCAADDGYSDAAAQSLQEAVLAVTQASHEGDWVTAQERLDDAAARLAQALAAGEISEERAAEITAAIGAVREDLDALLAVQQQQEQQDTQEDNDGPGNSDGNGNGNGPGKGDDDDKDKGGKKDG